MSSLYKREWRKRKAALSALADSSSDEEGEVYDGQEDNHSSTQETSSETEHQNILADPCKENDFGYK